jgi:hypothetical protein
MADCRDLRCEPEPQADHQVQIDGDVMLKFLGSAVGIIFIIGLLVVIGLLALIF